MKKTLMTIVGLIIGYTACYAGPADNNNPSPAMGEQGISLAGYWERANGTMVPYLHGFYKCFEAGFGLSWHDQTYYINASGNEFDKKLFLGYFAGYRYNVGTQGYVTAGFAGDFRWISFPDYNDRVYTIGAYVGLEYFLSENFMLNMQIMPYSYDNGKDMHNNEIFQKGKIGVGYVF